MSKNGSFEESLEALEEIVTKLEEGDLPLERSLELFEEGVKLSRRCQEKLAAAERRIEMLVKDSEGNPALEAFEEEDVEETG
ncbi:MAG TPA: exodeoxyribonuclease VII small subunit [Aridibacter sp.]|nr:exodeoxyribonuclease VII small subunit [Aridibacter sp.]